jgi:hypothetical protein
LLLYNQTFGANPTFADHTLFSAQFLESIIRREQD